MISIHEIIKNLYLGDKSDAEKVRNQYDHFRIIDVRNLIDEDFNEILNLEMAQQIVEAIEFHLQCDREVLVHCDCGMERSPLVVAVYLSTYKNMDLNQAYELIKEKRPCIFRRDDWIQSLQFPFKPFVYKIQ